MEKEKIQKLIEKAKAKGDEKLVSILEAKLKKGKEVLK